MLILAEFPENFILLIRILSSILIFHIFKKMNSIDKVWTLWKSYAFKDSIQVLKRIIDNGLKTTGNGNITAAPLSQPVWPSFCGLQFNTKTLELRGNYSNYEGDDIIHCITPSARKPGELLLRRIQAVSTCLFDVRFPIPRHCQTFFIGCYQR